MLNHDNDCKAPIDKRKDTGIICIFSQKCMKVGEEISLLKRLNKIFKIREFSSIPKLTKLFLDDTFYSDMKIPVKEVMVDQFKLWEWGNMIN